MAAIDLEICSADTAFLCELEARYGDCAASSQGVPALKCFVSRAADGQFLELEFSGDRVPDPFESALTPFRMLRHLQGKVVQDDGGRGGRALVSRERPHEVLVAGDSTRLRVRLNEATRDLALDSIIAVALRSQPDVLFLHAASFAVGGRGALIVGPAKSGKSTTVLALASRGHFFLGDDLAAVHARTRELLPLRKSAGLRAGPHASEIEARARPFRALSATGLDGVPRKYVRVDDMFPAAPSGPTTLDFAFILDGFADSAHVSCYSPSLRDLRPLKGLVSENVPGWGDSAGADLVKFLRVLDVFSRVQCYLLKLAELPQSAMLIEQTMRNP